MSFGFSSFGNQPFGGIPINPGAGTIVVISGLTVDHAIGSLRVTLNLNAISTARCRVWDKTNALDFQPGEDFKASYNGWTIFRGTIERTTDSRLLNDLATEWTLEAVDYTRLASRFIVNDSFVDQPLNEIVTKIVNENTPLSQEGVTLNGVQADLPTVSLYRTKAKTADKVLKELAEQFGLVWYIDHKKDLKFFDRTGESASVSFGDAFERSHGRIVRSRDRARYRNRQFLIGGSALTDPQSETFEGDGEERSFLTKYEVSETKPELFISTSGGPFIEIPPGLIGVQGVNDEDAEDVNGQPAFPWFFRPGSDKITQNSNSDPLTENQVLRVDYIGLFPMRISRQDDDEIAARAVVEGGSGIYENVEKDESIDGLDFGVERTEAILDEFGRIQQGLRLNTFTFGAYRQGQLVTLDLPEHTISDDWLIERVIYNEETADVIAITLDLVERGRPQTEFDFWRRMEQSGREFAIGEGQALVQSQSQAEIIIVVESFTADDTGDQQPAKSADIYTIAVIGSANIGRTQVVGGERVGFGGCRIGQRSDLE